MQVKYVINPRVPNVLTFTSSVRAIFVHLYVQLLETVNVQNEQEQAKSYL